MFQFFLLNENLPFSIALAVMLGISILEILSVIGGVGLSHLLDNLLHHPHIDFDHDIGDVHHDLPLFTKFLGWIRYGHVPILVVFISFLTVFSILGFTEQLLANNILHKVFSWKIAIWPPLFLSIPFVRSISLILGQYCFKDESTAISTDTFVGKTAVVTIGTARQGFPTEAKLIDQFQQTHYLMVEPINDDSIPTGSRVFIVEKRNHIFLVRKDS